MPPVPRRRSMSRCCSAASSTASTPIPAIRARVIVRDYKSGAKRETWPAARWLGDRQIQVALYMIAAERLLEARAVAGFYQPLAGEDLRPRGALRGGPGCRCERCDPRRARPAELEQLLERSRMRPCAWRDAAPRRADAMPGTLLARRDLPLPGICWAGREPDAVHARTDLAIERRRGELLLDAGAGSGKTSVLVERFARAVMRTGSASARS